MSITALWVPTVLFTREKAVINIGGNIKISISPTNGLYTLTSGTNTEYDLEVGLDGLYSCCCRYYHNFVRDSNEIHGVPTPEETQCEEGFNTLGGMIVEHAYLSNALSLLHRCYGHIPISR